MSDFIKHMNGISEIHNEASNDLLNVCNTKTFNKNDFLLKSGEVCKYLYFLDEGLIKSFFYNKIAAALRTLKKLEGEKKQEVT